MAGGKLAQAMRVYADRRMAKILFLGFISGFPWLLIGSMLSLWLKDEGLSRTGIGLFGLVGVVYAINALWAPLVDGLPLPFLSKWLGRRRAWIVAMQGVIVLAMFGLFLLPNVGEGNLWWVALFIFIIATASATQDVAIDATRIEMFGEEEAGKVGAGAAMATSGWWLGFGGGKALAFPFIAAMQAAGVENAWQSGYLSLTIIVALCAAGVVLFLRPPAAAASAATIAVAPPQGAAKVAASASAAAPLARAADLFVAPVADFFRRYGMRLALSLLLFIFFFKIGEAFLGRMSLVFYKEVGFSISEIGLLSGGLGTVTVCVFAVFGGFFNARYGLFRGIILGGVAMAATNFLFAALAENPERWLFVVAVVADQFTTAVSTVAFVAFLSQLCDRAHTATQYAALASLGNLSRTTLAAASGALVDGLGGDWPLFFVLTVLMVSPSLVVLFFVRKRVGPLLAGATTKLL